MSPKSLKEQVGIIRSYWPHLEPTKSLLNLEHSQLQKSIDGKGSFAFVKWSALADTYCAAFEKEMLPALKSRCQGNLFNFFGEGIFSSKMFNPLRFEKNSLKAWEKIYQDPSIKDGTIFAITAHFGQEHYGGGASIEGECRRILDSKSEFGLGAFAVTNMLLTHPERLSHPTHSNLICFGDEVREMGRPELFDGVLVFSFAKNSRIHLGTTYFYQGIFQRNFSVPYGVID